MKFRKLLVLLTVFCWIADTQSRRIRGPRIRSGSMKGNGRGYSGDPASFLGEKIAEWIYGPTPDPNSDNEPKSTSAPTSTYPGWMYNASMWDAIRFVFYALDLFKSQVEFRLNKDNIPEILLDELDTLYGEIVSKLYERAMVLAGKIAKLYNGNKDTNADSYNITGLVSIEADDMFDLLDGYRGSTKDLYERYGYRWESLDYETTVDTAVLNEEYSEEGKEDNLHTEGEHSRDVRGVGKKGGKQKLKGHASDDSKKHATGNFQPKEVTSTHNGVNVPSDKNADRRAITNPQAKNANEEDNIKRAKSGDKGSKPNESKANSENKVANPNSENMETKPNLEDKVTKPNSEDKVTKPNSVDKVTISSSEDKAAKRISDEKEGIINSEKYIPEVFHGVPMKEIMNKPPENNGDSNQPKQTKEKTMGEDDKPKKDGSKSFPNVKEIVPVAQTIANSFGRKTGSDNNEKTESPGLLSKVVSNGKESLSNLTAEGKAVATNIKNKWGLKDYIPYIGGPAGITLTGILSYCGRSYLARCLTGIGGLRGNGGLLGNGGFLCTGGLTANALQVISPLRNAIFPSGVLQSLGNGIYTAASVLLGLLLSAVLDYRYQGNEQNIELNNV